VSYWARVTLVVMLTAGVLFAARSVLNILVLVLIAVVLAVGLEPAMRTLERWGIRRGVATALMILAVIVLATLFVVLLAPPLVTQVREFADAVHKGDTVTAWSLLSSRTQAEADRAADAGHETGRQMLFTSALPGRAIEPKLVAQSGDAAEVRTSEGDGGESRSWRLVREGGRWRIDLDLGR